MDNRKWHVLSSELGSDPGPFSTQQIFDCADELNREAVDDHRQDYVPFHLHDLGNTIINVSHDRGDADYLVAQLHEQKGGA